MKTTLGDAVSDVRASERLTDSAVCLVAPETGIDRQLERLLAGAGRLKAAAKPILEINPRHELIASLAKLGDDEKALKEDAAHLLFDEARVLDGERRPIARVLRAAGARAGTAGAQGRVKITRPFESRCHTRPGVYGISRCFTFAGLSASITALASAGTEPVAPASPAPLAPSGLAGDGTPQSISVIGGR